MTQQLVEWLEMAAMVAAWPEDMRKCTEFFLCLREDGLSWYNMLDHIIGFDKQVWAEVKKEFLAATHQSSQHEHCAFASRTFARSQTRQCRSFTTGYLILSSKPTKPSLTIQSHTRVIYTGLHIYR